MRNFGNVRIVTAEGDVQTNRLGVVSGMVTRAMPARLGGPVCENASRRSFRIHWVVPTSVRSIPSVSPRWANLTHPACHRPICGAKTNRVSSQS